MTDKHTPQLAPFKACCMRRRKVQAVHALPHRLSLVLCAMEAGRGSACGPCR